MEFIDEDARPRFVFQSRPIPSSVSNQETQHKPLNKPLTILTISLSSILFILSILFIQIEPFKSLLLWVSISFIVGPLAPSNITGGDISVGQGPIFEAQPEEESETVNEKRVPKKRSKQVRSDRPVVGSIPISGTANGLSPNDEKIESWTRNENGSAIKSTNSPFQAKNENGSVTNEEEKQWSEEDFDMLRKQLVKNPVGKPRRWEVIAEAFKGKHRVESVIKMAKEMGEKRLDDSDAYARFLKNRKPLDARVEAEINGSENKAENEGVSWSSGEDIALLNAMKAFPKDVAMRWEKIAAAVPGKSKAACTKRIAELKRDFRSSKEARGIDATG